MKITLMLFLISISFCSFSQEKGSFIKYNGFGGEVSTSYYFGQTKTLTDLEQIVNDPSKFFPTSNGLTFNFEHRYVWMKQKGFYCNFQIDSNLAGNSNWSHHLRVGIKSVESHRLSFSAKSTSRVSSDTLFSNSEIMISQNVDAENEFSYFDKYNSVSLDISYLVFSKTGKVNIGTGLKLETEFCYQSNFSAYLATDTITSNHYFIKSDTSYNITYNSTNRRVVYQNADIPKPFFFRLSVPMVFNFQLPKMDEKPNHINFYLFCNSGLDFYLGKGSNKWVSPFVGVGTGVNYMLY